MLADIDPFGLTLLIASAVVVVALLSNRISGRLRIPAPIIFLFASAAASDLVPALRQVTIGTVEQIVTVALVVILFDGGMHIGVRKLRATLGPVVTVGVIGTFLTAGALALAAHLLFGLDWRVALLLGTALAPTDPAVVFSVLGNHEISGRTGVIVEGESGANDPVGIALLVSLLAGGTSSGIGATIEVLAQFGLQMLIGAAIGVAAGLGLRAVMTRPMPSEGLYPLRTLALAIGLYGVATVAHGSGFLAVFVAGILVGDEATPFKREIEHFHNSLSSLAEIITFIALGLTVSLTDLFTSRAWVIGLMIAVMLGLVIRPLMVGPLLLATRLRAGERIFVLWAGLKGAVPILLGTYILTSPTPHSELVYDIIFMVVAFSVLIQGGLVPTIARRCGLTMRPVKPRPWSLGVRLHNQPEAVHRYHVMPNAPAEGKLVHELHLTEQLWINLIVRDGRALPVTAKTTLQAGDEILLLSDPSTENRAKALFDTEQP